MKKEIVINAAMNEVRVAITEDGRLSEFYIELPDKERFIGNIYLGKVNRIMQGLNAAFVNIGLNQDAFLHFSDIDESMENSIISDEEDEGIIIDEEDDFASIELPPKIINASDTDTRDYYLGQGLTATALTALGIKGAASSNALKESSLFGQSGAQINNIKNILQPSGELIGVAGTDSSIRVMTGGTSEAQELFNSIANGGKLIKNTTYQGTLIKVEGGYIGIRSIQTKSPNTITTIDINVKNIPITKIKFNP